MYNLQGKAKFIVYADKVSRQKEEIKKEKEILKVKVEDHEYKKQPLTVKIDLPQYEVIVNEVMIKIENNEFIVNFNDSNKKDILLRDYSKQYNKYIVYTRQQTNELAKKLHKYIPFINNLTESLRAFKILMNKISKLSEIYKFFNSSIDKCVKCIEECMKAKWAAENFKLIIKFRDEFEELQNKFEVIADKHIEIQEFINDIDDDKYIGQSLRKLLLDIQHLIEKLTVITIEPIDFYIEFINDQIEHKLLNKAERILKSTLSIVKRD